MFGNVSRFIDYLTASIGCDEFEVWKKVSGNLFPWIEIKGKNLGYLERPFVDFRITTKDEKNFQSSLLRRITSYFHILPGH